MNLDKLNHFYIRLLQKDPSLEGTESGFILSGADKPDSESGFVTQNDPSGFITGSEIHKPDGENNPVSGDTTQSGLKSPDGISGDESTKAPKAVLGQENFFRRDKYTNIQKAPFQGGMSDVYTAIQDEFRRVLIKRLRKEFLNDPIRINLFFQEYTKSLAVQHENLVRMLEKGEDVDGPYIVMDYIESQTLTSLIREGLPENDILKFSQELLNVLEYLHRCSIIHRDLKPDNILIDSKCRSLKLIDLGLAYSGGLVDNLKSAGTPKYMAPEIKSGSGDLDNRCDIYSFGIIVLEMFTKSADISGLNEIKNPQWAGIISKCIKYDKNDRYRYCFEIQAELDYLKQQVQSASQHSYNQNWQQPQVNLSDNNSINTSPRQVLPSANGKILLQFGGAGLPGDLMVDLFFNNLLIDKVSVKKGFRVMVNAVSGNNKLLFQGSSFKKEFSIMISDTSRDYKITFEYSRIARNFTDSFYIQ